MKIDIPTLDILYGNEPRTGTNGADLLEVGNDDQVFNEQFKALRSKLEYKSDLLGWKVIAFTSSIAGEGKTLTCAKIAASLASTKRKAVLLVDADIRKADLTKGMAIPAHPGLTEYLLGAASFPGIARETRIPGLKVISTGTPVSAPADLLAGERFRTFIAEAKKTYDVVLIDTPPVLPVADAMAVREQVDGFVFVYRAGFTPMSMFQQAVGEIGEKKILGVILNGVEPKSEKYYAHYYGHYYKPKGASQQEPAG